MILDRRTLLALGASVPLTLATRSVRAQAYPNQIIKLIVPFPPGGGTDVLTRLVVEKIKATAGWTFVIDNRPGAGGNIGLDALAKAKNDGYTLAMGQTSNLAINPTLYSKIPYDALKDFTPVTTVATQPVMLVVRQSSPFRTLGDILAAAKAKSEAVTMASSGTGTVTHLAGEMLARRAGVRFLHVPYRGAAPSLTDTLGGQVGFTFVTPPPAISLVKSGQLRALAVTSKKRLPALAEVPTIAESGFPDFDAADWKALVAPAGTPDEVVMRLNAEANKALVDADLIDKLHEDGSEPFGGSPKETAQFLAAEHARWAAIVRESGARVN